MGTMPPSSSVTGAERRSQEAGTTSQATQDNGCRFIFLFFLLLSFLSLLLVKGQSATFYGSVGKKD